MQQVNASTTRAFRKTAIEKYTSMQRKKIKQCKRYSKMDTILKKTDFKKCFFRIIFFRTHKNFFTLVGQSCSYRHSLQQHPFILLHTPILLRHVDCCIHTLYYVVCVVECVVQISYKSSQHQDSRNSKSNLAPYKCII